MTSPLADGVMAATHKLVQQAMTGQWQDVPKTIAERRVMLDRLAANATPQDQQWINALKQAMAESDAAVSKMTEIRDSGLGTRDSTHATDAKPASDVPGDAPDAVATVMDMITSSR